jgi:hypothetical protein
MAILTFHVTLISYINAKRTFMYRLFFALLMISVGVLTAFGMGDEVHEPSSIRAQEGKVVYVSISPGVNFMDESKIQQEDQNSTGHGKAK